MAQSDLEALFLFYWRCLALACRPQPVQEFRFSPPRRFRFDFAWPGERVAVEMEGGVWAGGRHVRGGGYAADCEKYNLATAQGWRVFRFTRALLENDPAAAIGMVEEALHG